MKDLNSNSGTYKRKWTYKAPTGRLSISNLTGKERRTLNLATATAEQTALFTATFANDWITGAYNNANYTITNSEDIVSTIWQSMSWKVCWKLATGMVNRNTGVEVDLEDFSILGFPQTLSTFDCDNYTLDDVRKLLYTLISLNIDTVAITNFTPQKLDVSQLAIHGITLVTEKAQDIIFDASDLADLSPSVPIQGDEFVWGGKTYEVMSLGEEVFNYTTSSRSRIRVHLKQVE